jgi:hypothetical protein
VHTGFGWGDLKEMCKLEDLGLDGRIRLKWVFTKWYGAVDWIDLVDGRVK